MYPGLDRNTLLCQQRSDAALKAALERGHTDEEAWRIADRARSEARAGIRNDTSSFAGKVAEGSGPVRLYTYAGRVIDPLGTGLASASTLD